MCKKGVNQLTFMEPYNQSKNLKPFSGISSNGGEAKRVLQVKNESPINAYPQSKNLGALDILTNEKSATPSGANKLAKAIYHPGRAGNGTNKGPR